MAASVVLLLLLHVPRPVSAIDTELLRAEANPRVVTVRWGGGGDFRMVSEAVRSVPEGNRRHTIVRIAAGVYREKLTVDRPYVTLLGDDPRAMPRITFGGRAAEYGTWDSATVIVHANYFVACNIVFENSAPRPMAGTERAQAVVLRITGDKAAFYNCHFYGYQDTLCDDKGKHYFHKCLIRGTVDFIFGNGRSLYEKCTIESLADGKGVTALIAQGRASLDDGNGFSFLRCNITGTGSAYLGRAWRPRARVVFAYTHMGSVVHPSGWDDMGNPTSQRSVFYGEYKCTGPGASTGRRVSYAKILSDAEAEPFLGRRFVRGATWILPPPRW